MDASSSGSRHRAWWLLLLGSSAVFVLYFALWSGPQAKDDPATSKLPRRRQTDQPMTPRLDAAPPTASLPPQTGAADPMVTASRPTPPVLTPAPLTMPSGAQPPASTENPRVPHLGPQRFADPVPRAFTAQQREAVLARLTGAVIAAADRMKLSAQEKDRLLKREAEVFEARDRFDGAIEEKVQAVIAVLGPERYAEYVQLRDQAYWDKRESDMRIRIDGIIAGIGAGRGWSDAKIAEAQAAGRNAVARMGADERVLNARQSAGLVDKTAPDERAELDMRILGPFQEAFGAEVLQQVVRLEQEAERQDETITFFNEAGGAGDDNMLKMIFWENPDLRPATSPESAHAPADAPVSAPPLARPEKMPAESGE